MIPAVPMDAPPVDPVLVLVVTWMMRLAGIATLLNAAEQWTWRDSLTDHGVWRPATLARRWGLLRWLLAPTGFQMLLLVQLLAAVVLVVASFDSAAFDAAPASRSLAVAGGATAMLLLGTLLTAMRFRGTVNGGSDGMLFTVLTGLLIALLAPPGSLWQQGGVLYVAAQLTLSYLRAGLVKLQQPAWWRGDALNAFLALPAYGVPPRLVHWASTHPRVVQGAGIAVMMAECASPVAWRSPMWCLGVMGFALAFHVAVALTFRLPRFLWAWGAALPSLWYGVHRLH